MVPDQIVFKAIYIFSLALLAVAIAFAARTISKLRNTSATYNVRLLPFAYFSLSAWIVGALQYVVLVSGSFVSLSNDSWLPTGLWLGLMQNVLWAAAIVSLHSEYFSRVSQTLPLLIVFPIVVVLAFLTYRRAVLTSETFAYVDAVSATTIFAVFAYSLLQWRLSKIFAAIFLLHGYSQWIWRSLWVTPWTSTQIIILLSFPLWRVALLVIWIRLISAMLQRAQRSYQEVVEHMGRLAPTSLLNVFKVMISSTVVDLAQERDAADRAIRSLHLARAEIFGSAAQSPLVISTLLAEQCDLFVLIVGARYGRIIESKGISVVEFEYEVARAQNPKKILVYVKDGVNREPRLEEFLKRVQDLEHGYFWSLFTTPEELFEKIQGDIARWLASQVSKT